MSIENSYLGLDFTISSSILIILIFSLLYIFRKKIFTFYYKDKSLGDFNNKLKAYLESTYPKIKFDYSIFQDAQKEPNPDTRRYLTIFLEQIRKLEFRLKTARDSTESEKRLYRKKVK